MFVESLKVPLPLPLSLDFSVVQAPVNALVCSNQVYFARSTTVWFQGVVGQAYS